MLRMAQYGEATELDDTEQQDVDPPVEESAVDEAIDSDEPSDGPVESEDSASAAEQVDLGLLEALLLSTHHPLTAGRLAEVIGVGVTRPVRGAIKLLNQQYEEAGRSFRIEQVAGGYQILTLPVYGEQLKKLHQKEADAKLTKAALETLAIVAYKQPVLRADVEASAGARVARRFAV